jgi:hypothetical protein
MKPEQACSLSLKARLGITATGRTAIESRQEWWNFSPVSNQFWEYIQPPAGWIQGEEGLWPQREADKTPAFSVKVKNLWS